MLNLNCALRLDHPHKFQLHLKEIFGLGLYIPGTGTTLGVGIAAGESE